MTDSTQRVIADDHDIRLDRWFKRHYPGLQHAMLEKMLRKGQVRVDGKKAKASVRVQEGQEIAFPDMRDIAVRATAPKRPVSAEAMAEAQRWVLYKDDHLLIINKPYGLAVQGGSGIAQSLDDLLDGLRFEKPQRPKLVHRLDRETTGVLALARDSKAAAALAKGFSGKTLEKTYWALISGTLSPEEGIIDLPLSKSTRGGYDFEMVMVDEDEGKQAITEYRVLDALGKKFALVELKPLTGRTHQLRVHMQAAGCPIVGDGKYGGKTDEAHGLGIDGQLHLHARRLVIPRNISGGKAIDVTAPLPRHMQESFKLLGISKKA